MNDSRARREEGPYGRIPKAHVGRPYQIQLRFADRWDYYEDPLKQLGFQSLFLNPDAFNDSDIVNAYNRQLEWFEVFMRGMLVAGYRCRINCRREPATLVTGERRTCDIVTIQIWKD